MTAIGCKVEIEFEPNSGTLVDISSRVVWHRIVRPRAGMAEDQTPTTLELLVLNHPDASGFCPLTPDSPVSPYYPNVVRDRRILVTATWAGGSSVRFFGWTDVFTPDAGERPPGTATVTITASCVLGRYARRRVLSVLGEVVLNPNGSGAGNRDYYPFNDDPDSTVLRGWDIGNGTAQPGRVIQPAGKLPGSMTLSDSDGGHLSDGQLEFTRGDDNAPAPVVLIPLRDPTTNTLGGITGWFRLTTDPAGAAGDDMISGYDMFGDLLWTWSVKVVATKVTWTLNDRDGNNMSFYATNAPRDEGWHYWLIQFNSATNTSIWLGNKGDITGAFNGSFTWPYDPRKVKHIVLGGRMPPARWGKQSNTFQGTMSSLILQYESPIFSYLLDGNPGVSNTSRRVTLIMNQTSAVVDTAMGGAVGGGDLATDTTPLRYTNSTRDLLSRWNEIARTTGGQILTRPYGAREYRNPANIRPSTPAVTLHAEQDLSAPDGGWQSIHDERPTRVTVTSPLGSFLVIDTPTEMETGLRLEGPDVATAAGSDGVARAVAGRIMSSGYQPRMSSFGCDLTTTSTDKVAALMALLPYDRLRVTALPAAMMGYSYLDVYASGWTETYDAEDQSCRFQFDTDPADDPPEGRFDDAEYGRFALGTNATVVSGGSIVGTAPVVLAGDTFTGTNGSTWSATWNTGTPATTGARTIQGNAGRLTTGTAGGYASTDRVAAIAAAVAPAAVVWRGRFRWPTGDECYPRVYVRSSSTTLDGNSGYYIDFNRPGNTWEIGKSVGYTSTPLGTTPAFSFTTGWYWVEFGAVGTSIRGKFWLDGTAEPAFAAVGTPVTTTNNGAASFTDSSITAAGSVGYTVGPGNTAGAAHEIDDVTLSTNFSDASGVGSTGTGTIVLTGNVLTTAGGSYPLDLDWNGERVTVSGVSGGSSPQTATVTARGVAPTVARAHLGGEPVDIWHALRFGA